MMNADPLLVQRRKLHGPEENNIYIIIYTFWVWIIVYEQICLTLWLPIQSISSWRSKCVAVTGMPTSETTLCSSENMPSIKCTDSGTVTPRPSGSSSTPGMRLGLRWGSREVSIPASRAPWRVGVYSPIPGSRPSKFIMVHFEQWDEEHQLFIFLDEQPASSVTYTLAQTKHRSPKLKFKNYICSYSIRNIQTCGSWLSYRQFTQQVCLWLLKRLGWHFLEST